MTWPVFIIARKNFPISNSHQVRKPIVCVINEYIRLSARVMYVQYSGGCAVPWRMSRTVEGYHQHGGGKSSVQWKILSTVEGHHQYSGGISSVRWRILSTVEGYHQYGGGISSVHQYLMKFQLKSCEIKACLYCSVIYFEKNQNLKLQL